jgi:hypothetical protein
MEFSLVLAIEINTWPIHEFLDGDAGNPRGGPRSIHLGNWYMAYCMTKD